MIAASVSTSKGTYLAFILTFIVLFSLLQAVPHAIIVISGAIINHSSLYNLCTENSVNGSVFVFVYDGVSVLCLIRLIIYLEYKM